ncbi:MAG: pitrilysin family protein [Chitinophagaceae bacterium]|nr:pitrilysin family protein [Chitinophagaceae bacterium]
MKKIIISLAIICSGYMASAQLTLVEKVEKKSAAEIVIPFERYTMPNGLTVILHEDHSDPIVHVDVTYHVGSAREEIGKSGFAHFFEHMMFQGSDHVADEQHFKIITEAGGTLNGTTNKDRTNYFETVPSNQLEKMLWLESDRMGFLVNAVTQQKFEVQRGTVKNERGQNYDNRPYGLVGETAAKNLYPYGHPYSWLTIGYVEDLNRVNVEDLKNFFLRWYGPNNAVLTIGGDLDKAQTLKWVEKYFGTIPMGPKVEDAHFPAVVLEKDRYATMTDNYAKNQMLNITIPTVPAHHPDEVALDCLAQILGGDNNSILYQALVKSQKATRASCNQPTDELAGNLNFSIMPAGTNTLADMEKAVREALSTFERKGASDDDINKFIAGRETGLIYGLESVSGKVSQLASSFTFEKDANAIVKNLAALRKLTKEDVMRVYQKYIANQHMLILNVLTKDKQTGKAGEDNYTVDESKNIFPIVDYTGLQYKAVKDNFDRNKMPASGANPGITVPKISKELSLKESGIKMMAHQTTDLPIVNMSISLKGGRYLEQKDLSKLGITNLFTQMMDEDTKAHSSEEFSVLLDKLGSSISIFASGDELNINVGSLSKNVDATLDLLNERLLQPLFTQDNLDRIKGQVLSNLKNSKQNASYVAGIAYSKMMYGTNNILGLPSSGTPKTIEAITLSDIENYYNNNISKLNANIVVVGDYKDADITKLMSIVEKLPSKKLDIPVPAKAKATDNKTVYIVNIPKAAQTEFRIGYPTNMLYDATGEYYKSTLMNFPLGGAFNSHINLNLREDKAWTYGARANFGASKYTGTYTFSSGIKTPVTDSALIEVMKELNSYASTGITKEELSFTKNAIGQSDARKYETGMQKAGFISNMMYYNLPSTYVAQQNKILNSITKAQIDALAKKWITPAKMMIVLAGDKDKIAPGIEKLGYKIVELDSDGEVK